MKGFETCPKCSAHFEGRGALVWGGVATSHGFTLPAASSKVCCPRCGYIFPAKNVRFFGFLSAPALCLVLLTAVVVGLLIVMLSSVL
jgi:uncharacterized C2H2 Zn-finger protein